jgi:CRP-like cAMP-binding protein
VRQGDDLLGANTPGGHAFFPAGATFSVVSTLRSGSSVEAAMVGREGFIGLTLAQDLARGFSGILVIRSGNAYRIPFPRLMDLAERYRELTAAVLTYAGFSLNVAGRLAACNAYHSIEERLARWLLTMRHTVGRDAVSITHQTASQLLGATRPKVSRAAGRLKASGIVSYLRGVISISNVRRLQELSCECYEVINRYQRALPWFVAHAREDTDLPHSRPALRRFSPAPPRR